MLAMIAPGRAGGVRRLERAVQPRGIQPAGPGQHQRALGIGGQRLVRAGHHGVRARRDRVRRQIRVEAQVRGPRRVHDERDTGLVGGGRVAGEVAGRCPRRTGHRGTPRRRPGARPARPGPRPPGPAAGSPEAGSTSGRTHTGRRPASTRPSSSDRCRLLLTTTSWPGAPTASARAWLPWVDPATENRHQSAPHSRAARCSASWPQRVRVLDRVQPAIQRDVARHYRADQVVALLVPGDAHRRSAPRRPARWPAARRPGAAPRIAARAGRGSAGSGASPVVTALKVCTSSLRVVTTSDESAPAAAGYRQARFVVPPGAAELLLIRHGEVAAFTSGSALPAARRAFRSRARPRRTRPGGAGGRPASRRAHRRDLHLWPAPHGSDRGTAGPATRPHPAGGAGLREVRLGIWEAGVFRKMVAENHPIAQRMWSEERWDVIPGAEPGGVRRPNPCRDRPSGCWAPRSAARRLRPWRRHRPGAGAGQRVPAVRLRRR